MTPAQATKGYKYVRQYGRKWTALQVAQFFVALARLADGNPTMPTESVDG